jgi:hypothetical protein
MSDVSWYEVIEGPELLQGDIIRACPLFRVAVDATLEFSEDTALDVDTTPEDVVVLSQSCDLENDNVEDVLLGQVSSWEDVVRAELKRGNTFVNSSKFRKQLVDGNVPGFSLLHERTEDPILAWSVVNFHRLYTLPKGFLLQHASATGPRLRLRSPYREHLSQVFARYFMRVGLPHNARAFETEGKVET